MPFKLTIFMTAFRQAWSEAYYNSGNYPSVGGGASVDALLSARGALLGNNANLFAARISQFPANRLVSDYDINVVTQTGTWTQNTPAFENPTNIANVAFVVKMKTAAGSKLIYLAGLPEGVVQPGGVGIQGAQPKNVTGFNSLLSQFINLLVAQGWGCRSQRGTVVTQANGLQAGTQTPPLVGVQFGAPVAGVAVGTQVLMAGWRRKNPRGAGLSGLFTVASIVPAGVGTPQIYYLLNTQAVDPTNFKTIGKMGPATFNVQPFTSGTIDKATTRKRGVRSLAPLGKFSRVH